MKSIHLLFIFSCLLLQNKVLVSAQLSFSQLSMNPSNAGTVTTAANGILLNLKPNNNYGFILSDPISITTTPTEFYVTVVCTNTVVDYGLTVGPGSTISETLSASKSLLTNSAYAFTDFFNLYYPGRVIGGTTAASYIPALGEPVRLTLTAYTGSTYYEIKIRDMAGNYLMDTPYNQQGVSPGQSRLKYYLTTSTSTFGFEVLNCGQAIFCVQTAAQALANPGNCDGGATTSSSCSSSSCSAFQVCSGSTPWIQSNTCVAGCGTGYTEQSGKICERCTGAGCNTCQLSVASYCFSCLNNLFLSGTSCVAQCPTEAPYGYTGKCWKYCPSEVPYEYNNACYTTCPPGSYASSSTTCALCTSPCSTCDGGATTCTACDSSAPILYNSACYSTCQSAAPLSYSGACYSSCPTGTTASSDNTCSTSVVESQSNSDSHRVLAIVLGTCLGAPFAGLACYFVINLVKKKIAKNARKVLSV